MSSRGCPYRCTFCFNNYWANLGGPRRSSGKAVRQRSVDHFVAELAEARRRYRIKYVDILDDIFTLDLAWLREFARRYRKEVGVPFKCLSHVHFLDEAKVAALKEAGCLWMQIGVQSRDDDYKHEHLRRNEKQARKELATCWRWPRRAKIAVKADHIFGLPGETFASQDKAYAFYSKYPGLKRIHRPSELSYLPGTEVVEEGLAAGRITQAEVDAFNHGSLSFFNRELNITDPEERQPLPSGYVLLFRLLPILPWERAGRLRRPARASLPSAVLEHAGVVADVLAALRHRNPDLPLILVRCLHGIEQHLRWRVGLSPRRRFEGDISTLEDPAWSALYRPPRRRSRRCSRAPTPRASRERRRRRTPPAGARCLERHGATRASGPRGSRSWQSSRCAASRGGARLRLAPAFIHPEFYGPELVSDGLATSIAAERAPVRVSCITAFLGALAAPARRVRGERLLRERHPGGAVHAAARRAGRALVRAAVGGDLRGVALGLLSLRPRVSYSEDANVSAALIALSTLLAFDVAATRSSWIALALALALGQLVPHARQSFVAHGRRCSSCLAGALGAHGSDAPFEPGLPRRGYRCCLSVFAVTVLEVLRRAAGEAQTMAGGYLLLLKHPRTILACLFDASGGRPAAVGRAAAARRDRRLRAGATRRRALDDRLIGVAGAAKDEPAADLAIMGERVGLPGCRSTRSRSSPPRSGRCIWRSTSSGACAVLRRGGRRSWSRRSVRRSSRPARARRGCPELARPDTQSSRITASCA